MQERSMPWFSPLNVGSVSLWFAFTEEWYLCKWHQCKCVCLVVLKFDHVHVNTTHSLRITTNWLYHRGSLVKTFSAKDRHSNAIQIHPFHVHDDVIKWNHFPRYCPFVRGSHRSPMNSLHKGQWRGTLMFSLICTRTSGKVNNRDTGDLRHHCAHYDVTAMFYSKCVYRKQCDSNTNYERHEPE